MCFIWIVVSNRFDKTVTGKRHFHFLREVLYGRIGRLVFLKPGFFIVYGETNVTSLVEIRNVLYSSSRSSFMFGMLNLRGELSALNHSSSRCFCLRARKTKFERELFLRAA